jgi:type IV fimbrial biogenesis protein FimT
MGYTGSGTSRFRPRRSRPGQQGFTLLELLIGITILGLLLGIGVPALQDLQARNRASATLMNLQALLALARSEAMTQRREVTLCGTQDGSRCARDWQSQTLVFLDANRNRRVDAGEQLVARMDVTRRGSLHWRASGGRHYLRFRANGSVKEFGTFSWCPQAGEPQHGRAIIVSFVGRARAAVDGDGDGVVEDSRGDPLSC